MNLNELGKAAYENAVSKGFYLNPPSVGERIALMHSELSEALEADRKDLMDDKLTHRSGVEVELADCIIRIIDFCAYKGYDIQGAIEEKMAYNSGRPFMHGGKKY